MQVQSKLFKYSPLWVCRHLIHSIFLGVLCCIFYFVSLDFLPNDPYVWFKFWLFLTVCCLFSFLCSWRSAISIEVVGKKVTLGFVVPDSYTFILGQVSITKESRPSKVKNSYGVEELKFSDSEKVAYVPLKMRRCNEFLSVIDNYIIKG